MIEKLPFGLGRFFARLGGGKVTTELPELTKPDDLFRPEESIISFYAQGNVTEEKIRQQLEEQYPNDSEKRERVMTEIQKRKQKGGKT